jgi:hypothetical protein
VPNQDYSRGPKILSLKKFSLPIQFAQLIRLSI